MRPEPRPSTHANFIHEYGNSIGNGAVIPIDGGDPPSIFTARKISGSKIGGLSVTSTPRKKK